MEKNLCISCQKRPVFIKKRELCSRCYQRLRNTEGAFINPETYQFNRVTARKYEISREIEFIQNFFTHRNYVYQPASFRLDGTSYSPDFYDAERKVFIEVAGTYQAYYKNKQKYNLFRQTFPTINFEIRKRSGEILNEDESIHSQLKVDISTS